MYLWAGIDEAGYGPLIGPLVVAGTFFTASERPSEGFLWDVLSDTISDSLQSLDGRLVVADSKKAYSRSKGLKHLEETILSFSRCLGESPETVDDFLRSTCPQKPQTISPWFADAGELRLPSSTNRASIESKAGTLKASLDGGNVSVDGIVSIPVLPVEFNRVVACTRNKSLLLWQKCGFLLQYFWRRCHHTDGFVLVDRHGGRLRYRRLLKDAFPQCSCDILREDNAASVYLIADAHRKMWVAFKPKADGHAVPVALASMLAKYVRELYMLAFNSYWKDKIKGIKPTAGYTRDARRFIQDIQPFLEKSNLDYSNLLRQK